MRRSLVQSAVDAHDDAEHLGVAPVGLGDEDGRHVAVRLLEPDVLTLRVVVLAGGLVADQSDDHFTPLRGELFSYENEIAIEDAGVDHGVAGDA